MTAKLKDPVDAQGRRLGPEAFLNDDNPPSNPNVLKSYSPEYIAEQEAMVAELQLFQAELQAKRERSR